MIRVDNAESSSGSIPDPSYRPDFTSPLESEYGPAVKSSPRVHVDEIVAKPADHSHTKIPLNNNSSSRTAGTIDDKIKGMTPEIITDSRSYDNAGISKKNAIVDNMAIKPYNEYGKDQLNYLISLKNKYFSLDSEGLDARLKGDENYHFSENTGKLLKKAMYLKAHDDRYTDLMSLNYDRRLASAPMKRDIVNLYERSVMSLNELSSFLEQKYGMHISSKTISKYARETLNNRYSEKGLVIKNRCDARMVLHNTIIA